MPEIIQIEVTDMPWYYNVTQSVGKGGVNRRLDTMLVQYLIKKAQQIKPASPYWPKSTLAVDGMCGAITIAYIYGFQRTRNAIHPDKPVLTDSLVNRAVNDGIRGSISDKLYTIAVLNKAWLDHFPNDFNDPAGATDMPSELKLVMVGLRRTNQAVAA